MSFGLRTFSPSGNIWLDTSTHPMWFRGFKDIGVNEAFFIVPVPGMTADNAFFLISPVMPESVARAGGMPPTVLPSFNSGSPGWSWIWFDSTNTVRVPARVYYGIRR